MNILEVPTTELLKLIKEDFKTKLTEPSFTVWVKTGAHRERAPQQNDWWFMRTASILYRVFKDGPVGTESLRTYYGGRKNRGVKPEKFVKASGKIIRTCMQALEKQGFVKKSKKGRIITSKGHKYLNEIAKKINKPKKETIIKEEKKEVKEKPIETKKTEKKEAKKTEAKQVKEHKTVKTSEEKKVKEPQKK